MMGKAFGKFKENFPATSVKNHEQFKIYFSQQCVFFKFSQFNVHPEKVWMSFLLAVLLPVIQL